MHWRAIQQLHRLVAVVVFLAMAIALANYCALTVIADEARRQAERGDGPLDRIANSAETFLAQEYGR